MNKILGRKIIYKCRIGSHLYGTNTPSSDEDFLGVFIPSKEDIMGIENVPKEWDFSVKNSTGTRNEAGDVDCKFHSLPRFLETAAAGQPWALEMLFVPDNMVIQTSPEWEKVKQNKELILSRNGIAGFLGFATTQSYKASVKGENLNLIRDVIAMIKLASRPGRDRIQDCIGDNLDKKQVEFDIERVSCHFTTHAKPPVVNLTASDSGVLCVEIAGRLFNLGVKLKTFRNSLLDMEARYGSRVENAAQVGQDFKSLSHAYRLISEVHEYLATGHITLPRPDADFILKVKRGEYETDYREELQEAVRYIRERLVHKSPLREKPDYKKINQLCIDMQLEQIYSGWKGM